ncbi:ABC transporter transmembrane domain-containing protein [Roseateles sp. BYS78W]|uniref:ABC transporter transmembrane domain-containing protein n=1 Tax=Pelomonas candidula TaxID=3299025 RepID=A0ABW7HJG2_9BURK
MKEIAKAIPQDQLLWALGSVCALHRVPFAAELVARMFPPPCSSAVLVAAARAIGFKVKHVSLDAKRVEHMVFPLVVSLRAAEADPRQDEEKPAPCLGIITAISDGQAVLFEAGSNQPLPVPLHELTKRLEGDAWLLSPKVETALDPDAPASARKFGFQWFVPELLKHGKVWRDVLLASLALQLIALATPLFTQAIIDKVVVHRTESTLIAIAIAMVIFTVFSSLLTWVRQYLVLHTGNRVDAVLGAAVWEHLLKLPLRCWRRSKFDPPCRLNFDPGLGAGIG